MMVQDWHCGRIFAQAEITNHSSPLGKRAEIQGEKESHLAQKLYVLPKKSEFLGKAAWGLNRLRKNPECKAKPPKTSRRG